MFTILKKLSDFLIAGFLFFAGGTEGVLAAQAGSGTNFVEESVSQEAENPQNLGGLRQSVHLKVDKPDAGEVYRESKAKSKGSKAYTSSYDVYSTNFY